MSPETSIAFGASLQSGFRVAVSWLLVEAVARRVLASFLRQQVMGHEEMASSCAVGGLGWV